MRTIILISVLLGASLCGCQSMIEAIGYTVVDEELKAISAARDDATQEYITATLPLVEASSKEAADKAKLLDLGKTLARVSRKERILIVRDIE